jgi:hypothetical protein
MTAVNYNTFIDKNITVNTFGDRPIAIDYSQASKSNSIKILSRKGDLR